jgi:hypothetical protein
MIMSEYQDPRSFWSFWTTLPGILGGLAAVITAIGGLVTAIYLATGSEDPAPTPAPVLAPTRPIEPAVPAAGVSASRPNTTTSPASTAARAGSFPEALPISPGTTEGVIGPAEKVYHQFQAPPGGRLEITVAALGGVCLKSRLFDSQQTKISESAEGCNPSEYFSILTSNSSGGAYYLEVEGASTLAAGSYAVNFQSGTQDDAGTGGDAGDDFDTATPLQIGSTSQGLVGSQDPVDYYQFQAGSNTVLEVQYQDWNNLEVALFSPDASPGAASGERLRRGQPVDFSQRPAGRYFLSIANSAGEAVYTIVLGTKIAP